MRTLAVAFVLALLISASARADAPRPPVVPKARPPEAQEQSPATLPTDVQQLRDRWMQCTAAAAKADLRSSRPAEAVADAALHRCTAQEQPLARALDRQLGQEGAARVLERVREADRTNLIRAIEELRAR
jgi:hypothetical protein